MSDRERLGVVNNYNNSLTSRSFQYIRLLEAIGVQVLCENSNNWRHPPDGPDRCPGCAGKSCAEMSPSILSCPHTGGTTRSIAIEHAAPAKTPGGFVPAEQVLQSSSILR